MNLRGIQEPLFQVSSSLCNVLLLSLASKMSSENLQAQYFRCRKSILTYFETDEVGRRKTSVKSNPKNVNNKSAQNSKKILRMAVSAEFVSYWQKINFSNYFNQKFNLPASEKMILERITSHNLLWSCRYLGKNGPTLTSIRSVEPILDY